MTITATRRIGPILVTPLAYLSGCGACGTPRQEPGKRNGWRLWGGWGG